MSRTDANFIAAQVATLSASGLPLVEGLRVAAVEAGAKLSKGLRELADALERGVPLDEAVQQQGQRLPAHIRHLLVASARSHNLGYVLSEISDQRRRQREIWSTIVGAITYPLLVLLFSLGIFTFVMLVVIQQFDAIFRDFELKLPAATEIVLWWARDGIWILLSFLGTAFVLAIGSWLFLPRAFARFLLTTIPLFGPMWLWSGVAEWALWMSLMLEEQMPLPEALHLAACGVSDANISRASHLAAQGIESGMTLPNALWAQPRFPALLLPFVIAGEKTNSLPGALRAIAELFEERVRNRAKLVRTIMPPIVFVLIGFSVVSAIVAIFMPMVGLITGLSW